MLRREVASRVSVGNRRKGDDEESSFAFVGLLDESPLGSSAAKWFASSWGFEHIK